MPDATERYRPSWAELDRGRYLVVDRDAVRPDVDQLPRPRHGGEVHADGVVCAQGRQL